MIAITSLSAASGLHCLSCTSVVSPSDCDAVTECGTHEHCYTDTVISSMGSIMYNLGCRDKLQCRDASQTDRREASVEKTVQKETDSKVSNGTATGDVKKDQPGVIQHASSKRFSEMLVCSECCASSLCNSFGCGSKGYISTRGPVCFNCPQQMTPHSCNKIKICRQDEVCKLLKTLNPLTRETRYDSTCEKETKCNADIQTYTQMFAMANGQRRRRNSVSIAGSCHIQCCKSDLCNNDCSGTTTTPVVKSTSAFSSTSTITPTVTSPLHLDPCLSNPCATGRCSIYQNTYKCTCSYGFWGRNCDQAFTVSAVSSSSALFSTPASTSQSTTASTPASTSQSTTASTSQSTTASTTASTGQSTTASTTASTHIMPTEQLTNGNNPCLLNPCMRGICSIYESTYRCTCTPGFWGRNCELAIDYCNPDPCYHGTCTNHVGTFMCKCDNGYMGAQCDIPTNMCNSNPCQNGVCANSPGNYSCICEDGYSGRNYVCQLSPCGNEGNCTVVPGGYYCTCKPGWTGDHCVDIVCPAGWERYKEHCYFFDQSGGKSFYDALAFCQFKGGTLAEVFDEETNNFIKKMLSQRYEYQYWLGLSDVETEGQYKWISSKAHAQYVDWAPAEPDDNIISGEEDCAVYSSSIYHADWQWADIICSRTDAFAICEKRYS